MIINNVKITNFRCYYGTSNIAVNANGKITLVYGNSGYGKSSFLQFFRWMFYDDPDFGKNNDKPLFNIVAYNESKVGESVEVSGQIDFTHLGVSYRLNKTQLWTVSYKISNSASQQTDWKLSVVKEDGGYHPVADVANQINSILPKGLSKYFLLDGERARDIVLDSDELKKAIHSLFGLDAYTEAVSHIGHKNAKNSVLGYYNSMMAANISRVTVKDLSASELQEKSQELYDNIEDMKSKRKGLLSDIEMKTARCEDILKTLGAAASKGNIEQLLSANYASIKQYRSKIVAIQHAIGDLFYKNYPYLFLAEMASKSSTVLRQKNLEFASNYKNVFENLQKELLKEILAKNICVCGRELDEDTKKRIDGIIGVMPPDSYVYQFGQFVSRAKRQIRSSQSGIMEYEKYLNQIALCETEISRLEDLNTEKLDELRRLEDAKDLVVEIEKLKAEIEQLKLEKEEYEKKIAQKTLYYEASNKELNNILKNSKISSQFLLRISFFEKVLDLLQREKEAKERLVKSTLNACVREVFKKLTTQSDLDVDKVQFVNDDFSLRTTYLTGGQLAVDVYSYVIGIVKALQECNMENNENPIIIDAPFAFTGNEQSEYLFKTLPSVSKQTILLTLDLNKIKKLLKESEIYDFYIIKNDSQEKATIERGAINEFKF